jgi:hypothetical protein
MTLTRLLKGDKIARLIPLFSARSGNRINNVRTTTCRAFDKKKMDAIIANVDDAI